MTEPIANYTFLPWVRQGIASKIRRPDSPGGIGGERAAVRIALKVNDEDDFVANDVSLLGPGDVIGVHPDAVVRTEPRHWATDYEANYLAAIDFYDEDFPWRYTPAAAVRTDPAGNAVTDNHLTKLRPWIFVVALEESEFTEGQPPGAPLTAIALTGDPSRALPPATQAWAWAHVHISTDVTNAGANTAPQIADRLEDVVRANPDSALSRVVCPRKLKEETAYHAFLIPAFEIGRLAGLGLPTTGQDPLAPSWGDGQTQFPVYYRWFFRTAKRGDFEYLVNLLVPRPVDQHVGIRDIDLQAPGFGVPGLTGQSAVMGLEGALKSPQAVPQPPSWPPAPAPEFLESLAAKVNLQDDLLQPAAGGIPHPDPIISPPLYGRWHGMQSRLAVDDPGWVNELNRDPRLRVPAGCGTQVVQANQESYMQRAWQQLGDVLAANQRVRQFQVSITASSQMFRRSFATLEPALKIAVSTQVLSRVLGSPTTLAHDVARSRLPAAATDPAFRRLTRSRGVLMRRAAPRSAATGADMLTRMNAPHGITAATPMRAPEQQITLESVASSLMPMTLPDWLLRVLRWRWLPVALVVALLPFGPLGLLVFGGVLLLRRRALAAARLGKDNRTVAAVRGVPPRPGFVVTEPDTDVPDSLARRGASDSPDGARFRQAMDDLNSRLEEPMPDEAIGPPLDLGRIAGHLDGALDPATVISRRARSVIDLSPDSGYHKPTETIASVMAHPVIDDPMYRPLVDLSSELLVPNLALVPNNSVTLMLTNPPFIEAYIAGVNHEFARELLWREYPTDLRPSSFLLFWEPAEAASRDAGVDPVTRATGLRDFKPLHEWAAGSPLGTHENKPLPTGSEPTAPRVVLVIRGDLLKRYPTAIIYAQKGKWIVDPDDTTPPRRKIRVLDPAGVLEPTFKAEVLPDIRFLGFDMTVPQAKGSTDPTDNDPGYFFVIAERPGEPRFGLDIQDSGPPPAQEWTDLAWNHLGDPADIDVVDLTTVPATTITTAPDNGIRWAANAADMAYIFYQVPAMVAVHAENMLE